LAGTLCESPFDRLTVLSNPEGLTALREVEGWHAYGELANEVSVGSATVPTGKPTF